MIQHRQKQPYPIKDKAVFFRAAEKGEGILLTVRHRHSGAKRLRPEKTALPKEEPCPKKSKAVGLSLIYVQIYLRVCCSHGRLPYHSYLPVLLPLCTYPPDDSDLRREPPHSPPPSLHGG